MNKHFFFLPVSSWGSESSGPAAFEASPNPMKPAQAFAPIAKANSLLRTKSQPEIVQNIEQIWNSHCVKRKPIIVKKRKL